MPAPLLYNLYDTNPVATVDAHVLGLLSASSPLVYSNLTGVFTIQQASGTQAGFLSAADWTVFSAKQAALTLPLSIANGGTNNAGPFTAGSVIFSNGTSLTQDNAVFFWDDTAKAFCVGTVTQVAALTVAAQIAGQAGCSIIGSNAPATAGVAGGGLTFQSGVGASPASGAGGAGGSFTFNAGAGGVVTLTNVAGGVGGAFTFNGAAGGNNLLNRAGGVGSSVTFQGGTGGNNTNVSGSLAASGGAGGSFTLLGGTGGTTAGGAGIGGVGGSFTLHSGAGGASAGSGAGGAGGSIGLTALTGGAVSGSGTAGVGGSITLLAGTAGSPGGSGTGAAGGNVQLIPGAGSGAAANGAIIFGSAAGNVVNFIAGSGAAAPSTSVGVAIVNYYGSSATNFLGTPNAWLSIQANGVTYRLPLYT